MTGVANLLPELVDAFAEADVDLTDLRAARLATDTAAASRVASLSYAGVDVELLSAPGLGEAPAVPIRLLRPSGATGAVPVLVAMHGGGFVLGRSQDFDYLCLEIVRELGIAVANVEYRLAPETPFPGPLDDCAAALRHIHSHAAELSLDPDRIAVGGSSAGGGLAAGTVLRARDEGWPPVAFQVLLSPALDDRPDPDVHPPAVETATSASSVDRTGDLVWRYYLGPGYGGPGDADVSVYAAPARADDLSGLPPTYIATMEIDPVRDQDIRFALGLLDAGVSVELHSHAGTFHGSIEFAPEAPSSARIRRGILDALAGGLHLGNRRAGL